MSTMETEDTSFKAVFLINLAVYNPIKPIGKKTTEEKVNKLKEGNEFTYQFKDRTILPLNIYMIKEWARAWYEKMSGVSDEIPPNTATFDASKLQPLHPSRRAPAIETPTYSSTSYSCYGY
ncbi:hypothetical protein BDR04DRAFT_1230939 [Suillus decipiens]|nr:hypothetical protein BDR04DRAFT_1230939 [Suillus decipiens]